MKLTYVRGSFDAFSGKVSDLSRQLALAGIAIIWIFKIDNKVRFNLPNDLYWPLYFLCLSLLTDLFQYIYGTIAWGIVLRNCGKDEDDDNLKVSPRINTPTWILFMLKVLLLLISYYYLLKFLVNKV